jgi:signal transduction histidine kinase
MDEGTLSVVLGSLLIFITFLLEILFGYLYIKDKDKRKLMYMIAFGYVSISYLSWIQPAIKEIWILDKMIHWSAFPIISATLITTLSNALNWKNFSNPFRAFLLAFGATNVLAFAPPHAEAIFHTIFIQVTSSILICILIYLVLKNREITTLNFLLSMICFMVAGMGWAFNAGAGFIFFANAFGIVFIILVFIYAKSTDESLSSFFAIKSELEKAQRKLSVYEEKLRIVGSLTRHDVRNKLSTITGNVFLAKKMLPPGHKIEQHLNEVMTAVNQAIEIFDFARTYEKKGMEKLDYTDVNVSFKTASTLIANKSAVEITNDCCGLEVLADSLLSKIFYNLIDNSLKHGGKVTKIHLSFEDTSRNHIKLCYKDDGIGIPDIDKEKVFLEGYGKGTGYGLYIIKQICDVYGWTIRETGTFNKGVQFTFTIPKIHSSQKPGYKLHKKLP